MTARKEIIQVKIYHYQVVVVVVVCFSLMKYCSMLWRNLVVGAGGQIVFFFVDFM